MNLQITPLLKQVTRIVLSFVLFFVIGCTPQPEVEDAIDSSLKIPSAGVPPLPSLDVNCYQDSYAIPEESITRKIDILIIPDTSGSIVDERAAIADGFDSFLSMMPALSDVQVGVMLAHSGASLRSGALYKKGTEPLILSNQTLTTTEIKAHLRTKMQNPATDNASDGGEMGLYSLKKSLNENFSTMQSNGFYRDDAALVVIFVADEQDVCGDFPAGVTPVVDPEGKETSAYNSYCIDGSGNKIVTPGIVVNQLKSIYEDRPLIVGGVVYNNLNTITFKGENELGYGYLEAISLAGGISVDMANGDYSNGLSKLGTLAMTKLSPVNDFNLSVTRVDTSTIKTYVDEVSVPFNYNSDLNIVSLVNARSTFSVAAVQYCEKPNVEREVLQMVAGGYHTCGLLATGDVKCYGENNHGQLGYGHTNRLGDDENINSIGYVPLGEKAIQLVAGVYHTCALLESKKVRCWGWNFYGQLGLGHKDSIGDNEQVTDVPYINLGTDEVQRLYSGTYFNCALYKNGNIRCWGDNQYGQLGIGSTTWYGDDEVALSSPLVNLGGAALQMDLSTISSHACAILAGGVLKCWGNNTSGQLGIGNTTNQLTPVTSVSLPRPAIMVTTGNTHTCALMSDYNINCFGSNNQGQLGLGNSSSIGDNELPSSASTVSLGFEVASIYAGNFSTCAISNQGEAKCWGRNNYGQLGHGNKINIGLSDLPSAHPVINLGAKVNSVSGGVEHHCFTHEDSGNIKCIGQGSKGQLGNGNMLDIGDDETAENLSFNSLLEV